MYTYMYIIIHTCTHAVYTGITCTCTCTLSHIQYIPISYELHLHYHAHVHIQYIYSTYYNMYIPIDTVYTVHTN